MGVGVAQLPGAFLQNASPRCVLCRDESFPKLHTASLYSYSQWLSRRSRDSAVREIVASKCVQIGRIRVSWSRRSRSYSNHVACERRKSGEHWRVKSVLATSQESGVFKRIPNRGWRHRNALCKRRINVHHDHGRLVHSRARSLHIRATPPRYTESRLLRTRRAASCKSEVKFHHGHG